MIPYTLDRRTDTGVSNTTLGVWLFLASEVMLFGALFSSYTLLRVSAVAWPSGREALNLWLGGANTVLLSAVTMLAWRGRSRPLGTARRLLTVSSLLALLFLVNKCFEYRSEIAHGFLPSVSTFAAMYFTLTGFHALHVIGGLVANAWALAGRAGDAMTANRIRLLALYWAFVDAIWLIIFVLVYAS
jgi:cytochrome c oxidase subunit III